MSAVVVQRDGPVVRMTLDNPARRNALTRQMYQALESACADLDPSVRAVVVRGAGGRAFASGTDITEFLDLASGEDGLAYESRVGRTLDALARVPVPVVAVVEGPAVGAGLALAAHCDIVLATPDAVFGAPIARTLGNCLAPAVLAQVQSKVGRARTMAMLLSATLLSAADAAEAGLVTEVVDRADLPARLEALLERLAGNAPLTMAGLKEIDRRLVAGVPDADDVLRDCYSSGDFARGVRAFLAHEQPRWEGG